MTATTTQEHITRAARTGQEAISTALRGWGETAQTVLGLGATREGDVPSPDRLIDTWFDIADEALNAQREFAKALLTIGTPLVDAVSRTATRTIEATQHATNGATEATREAPQESSRAPRSSASRKDG
ncbi:hypothetical protein [Pseudonocardia sp.]|jgi:hypothetical protein|uniref:hypothetical protein n=1 Tax=Pseudonocardia sp. TaxID=60912 RepID=UPI0031FD0B68